MVTKYRILKELIKRIAQQVESKIKNYNLKAPIYIVLI